MHRGLLLWIGLVLVISCTDKGEKVTRQQCSKVADHVADLILDYYVGHPDEWWDALTAEPGDTGLPKAVTKETFKTYLESPEGKTWVMQRHGQARSGTEAVIDRCVEQATPRQVQCLLAAASKDDVTACDQKK